MIGSASNTAASSGARVRVAQEIRESVYESPIGRLLIYHGPAGVRALVFEEGRDDCLAEFRRRNRNLKTCPAQLPEPVRRSLDAYFGGCPWALDGIRLDLAGTPFQRRVWDALRRILPGRVLSYGALAEALGTPLGARAVGRAAATNPVSLIVPCHRLIGSDGSMTGFLWGIERKRWLLAHEAAHTGR